jgi:pimeloyl-ACP methyl ester carboxylesterase
MGSRVKVIPVLLAVAAILGALPSFARDDGEQLLAIDHYVPHVSSIAAIAGQTVNLYVRERALTNTVLRQPAAKGTVVLFVHGATVPSEAVFDLAYGDYSWMAFLAQAGFDTFAMDITGHGPSTRPGPMNDPCNASAEQQALLVPDVLASTCASTYGFSLGTLASDWEDIDQVVDYLRNLRHIDRISLVGWSMGGPRIGPYAAQHAEKVESLVILAPGGNYSRSAQNDAPPTTPGPSMTLTTRQNLEDAWDRQVNCQDQFDPAVRSTVWAQFLGSDPTGSTWRRA